MTVDDFIKDMEIRVRGCHKCLAFPVCRGAGNGGVACSGLIKKTFRYTDRGLEIDECR